MVTTAQRKALHLGCQQIADTLMEHGIPLEVALKDLEVTPTMKVIKDAFRTIAAAKYQVTSTEELGTTQIRDTWDDLTKTLAQNTGINFGFPSAEWQQLMEE